MKAYASYADWKKDQSLRNRRLITALERIVEDVAPGWVRFVKWGQGCWVDEGAPKIFIHTEADHVQFGFYAGSKMQDAAHLLVGKGKYVRHVKVHTLKDINESAFAELVREILT